MGEHIQCLVLDARVIVPEGEAHVFLNSTTYRDTLWHQIITMKNDAVVGVKNHLHLADALESFTAEVKKCKDEL